MLLGLEVGGWTHRMTRQTTTQPTLEEDLGQKAWTVVVGEGFRELLCVPVCTPVKVKQYIIFG